jgi:hypothetical protein
VTESRFTAPAAGWYEFRKEYRVVLGGPPIIVGWYPWSKGPEVDPEAESTTMAVPFDSETGPR